jgi:putative isomerase
MLERLQKEALRLGKPAWRPMLRYTAELHGRSILAPLPPFPYPWEEIGPGYAGSPSFGHWDIVHQILDALPAEPEHARNQVLNNLAAQQPGGLVPGTIWIRGGKPKYSRTCGHPPVWQVAADEVFRLTRDLKFLAACHAALTRQIGWFDRHRRSRDGGYFYADILGSKLWESGVDDGIRFSELPAEPCALVDATSHLYALHETAARWAQRLGLPGGAHRREAERLKTFIRSEMFDERTGMFQDAWRLRGKRRTMLAFEGMWPVVVGVATPEQARRVIDGNLLNPKRYFTKHPIASVSLSDPRFELKLWRGPAWNSMTYWAATGCMRYGHTAAARRLLGAALDQSAKQYRKTGTIWEFYHPHGGDPRECARKPYTVYNAPCLNYLGHNPLLAMARLWDCVA